MKSEITELTSDQKNLLNKYIQDGLKYGRSIEPINHSKCEEIITEFYKSIGKKAPTFMYFSSPIMCILAYEALSKLDCEKIKINKKLWNQLWDQLWNQLQNQLWNQLGDQLEGQLRSQLWSQLWNQLWNQLGNQLEGQLRSQLWSQLNNYFGGQQWLHWQYFYDYCAKIGVEYSEENNELLNLWKQEGENLHWWFPYENIVLISERPIRLSVNTTGQLHDESKKAIEYNDGWGFYYLNGIKMEEAHVTTESKKLDPVECLKESNVDVRRELIRKIGVELMLNKLPHKILDKKTVKLAAIPEQVLYNVDNTLSGNIIPATPERIIEYELLSIDFPGLLTDCRYLKMLNPSIQTFHIEGVEKTCNTVQDAINWRAGDMINSEENWEPNILT